MVRVAPSLLVLLLRSLSCNGLSSPLIDRRKSPALWRLLDYDETNASPHPQPRSSKPEVMAPAGGWPQLRAAVANGADAVYIGLSAFSARARANNFQPGEELNAAVAYCHNHGNVSVYVALNTVVFDTELQEVATLVEACETAGVDALIVQDVGVARHIVQHSTIPLHASTQQSVTDAAGVDFCASSLNATRVVVGRELSVAEIAAIRTDTEIEVFVHGALCVSYSGQCFSSEAWGGRSANRGQCAQACRLPYGLVVNGELRPETDGLQYMLSPQDLCGLDHVRGLIEAGVSCLKIEGRLKDATYVAATTRAYRNAVDRAWQDITGEQPPLEDMQQYEVSKRELQQLFSRGQDENYSGLSSGFLNGTQHQHLVRGRSPRHRGLHMGRVGKGTSPKRGIEVIGAECDLKLGDGICVDRGMPEREELGGSIYAMHRLADDRVVLQLSHSDMQKWKQNPDLVPPGAHVWKTHDATVEKKFTRLSRLDAPKSVVSVRVEGSVGEPLQVIISQGQTEAVGVTDEPLERATGNGLSASKVQKAIGLLGNTDFMLGEAVDTSGLDGIAWCPISKVKEARRRAVERFVDQVNDTQEQLTVSTRDVSSLRSRVAEKMETIPADHGPNEAETKLSVLCRDYEQVDALCNLIREETSIAQSVDEIMVDFLEIDGIRDAVARIRQGDERIRVVVACPRIIKPGESGIWKSLLLLEPDALLVRSAGLLHEMTRLGGTGSRTRIGKKTVAIPTLLGDFSLNVANMLTAAEYLSFGLNRVTASYDLNANAIAEMASLLGDSATKLEVVVHCKIPVFHTEHCVFARFLTKGDSYLDCGHACTRKKVQLRDNINGMDNLVLADMGCRNTVFSAQAQSGLHSLEQWRKQGIQRLRIELVDESPSDVKTIVQTYSDALQGKLRTAQAWASLDSVQDSNGRRAGVTLGSFKNGRARRAGEIS